MAMKRILVVDDSPIVLEACKIALEEAGFSVLCVQTPSFSLQDAMERPDLALIDVMLPGAMAGDDLARFMKQVSAEIPVLLFSDLDEAELRERAAAAGAQGYICKDWGMEELVRRVKAILTDQG